MTSLLDGSVDVDAIPAADLSGFFSSFADLSDAIASLCNEEAEDVQKQKAARFVALAKRDFDQQPSTSTGITRSGSADGVDGDEPGETLVDVLWALNQGYELGQGAQEAAKARSNLVDLIKQLIAEDVYNADFLKQRFDLPLLEAVGLLSTADVQQWTKLETRIKTSLLYKQQKFNLLREETEGYSKLEVELHANMGAPHDARTARPAEPMANIRKRAAKTVENIKGLIGYFDLDPSRTLDIILDVFADNVLYHHVFFRELLRLSPWAPKSHTRTQQDSSERTSLLPDGSLGEARTDSTSMCAQILGFKFAWFASGDGASETPSEKLYLLAAILIWDGFVDLANLWPHLSPSDDEGMDKLKDKFRDDISDRIQAAKSNALSMAGVLADDGPTSSLPQRPTGSISIAGSAAAAEAAKQAAQPEKVVEPANSRVGLLRALLSIGALEPAFFILSKYSWICDPHPDIADLLLRLCNYSITELYKSRASPFAAKPDEARAKQASLTQGRQRYSPTDKKMVPAPTPQTSITGRPIDIPKTFDKVWRDSTYFFAEWRDRLPIVKNSEELFDLTSQMLKLIGVHAGRNLEFLTRLLRLVRLDTMADGPLRKQWEGIIRFHLIPALALSEPNPASTMDLWDILRNYPYITRFSFYGEWKDRSYKRFPELRVKKAEAERDAKGLLKRLSVDNVKQFGRSLAKIAHTNPAILFEIALNQVQSYDNLIGPVVESARYLTPLGYDVLAYSLLDALSNPEKERTKTDGTNISLWLQSLATFSGTLCRRWNMDVSYILQYILNQLLEGNPKDLIVLRELISKMTGVEPVSDLSDSQVVALGGGRTLQSEALNPTTAVEKKNATKRSSLRLKVALQDSSLAIPLLVAVAIQRQECVFGDEDAPLKYLGNLFDQCQQVLFQYLDFLSSNFGAEQFSKMVPSLQELWVQNGIDAGVAFQIVRPSLHLAIKNADVAAKAAQQENMNRLKEELKASREAKSTKTASAEVDTEASDSPAVAAVDVKMEDVEEKPAVVPAVTNGTPTAASPWHNALASCVEVVQSQLPDATQKLMSAGFFVTFWQLSLYDILVPMARYQTEVDRLNAIVRELDASLKSSIPSYPGQMVDKAAEAEKKRARERLLVQIQALNADLKAHTEAYEITRKRLNTEKAHWFLVEAFEGQQSMKEASAARRAAVQHFLQECLTPRARLSPIDASYCARFVKILHSSGTPNFPSLHVYDKIFSDDLPAIIFSSTEGEARNYARFLHDCLADLTTWYKDETAYNKQAIGNNLPGFQRSWGLRKPGEPIPEQDFLKYNEFKLITHKWHKNLTTSFEACINTGDYMAIRNSVLIMTKLAKFYPLLEVHHKALDTVISNLISAEKREDLKVLALGYSALLKKQAPQMIAPGTGVSKAARSTPQPPAAPARAAPTDAPKVETSSAENKAAPQSTALPTGPRSGVASPAPASRPAGLPAKPMSEAERRRSEMNGHSAPNARASSEHVRPSLDSNRRTSELSVPNAPRGAHALPARPGSSNDTRREQSTTLRPPSHAPSPANSRPSTPVANRNPESMDIDQPEAKSKQNGDTPAAKEEFVKPARPASPTGSKASASRGGSPRPKDAVSPRAPRKEAEDTPREDRRSRRDESDRSHRRSRANSTESSHSSHRERRERKDSGRGSTTEKSEREDRKGRERRSDRERDKDREKDKEKDGEKRDRSDRDKDRDKDKDKERSSSRRERRESGRDGDSESRHRDDKRESSRKDSDRRDGHKERDRDRDSRRDSDRRSSGSTRREDRDKTERDSKRDEAKDDKSSKSRSEAAPKSETAQDTSKQQSSSGGSGQLKRSADSSTSLAETSAKPGPEDSHTDKRRKTEEPSIPSGPKADRRPPAPLSSLPPRASGPGATTSIKGRASSSATPDTATGNAGQGMRIRSAASVVSALSSAQQHNARQDRGSSRGGTPAGDAGTPKAESAPSEKPKAQDQPTVPSKPAEEGKPRGLLDRLGTSDSRPPNSNNSARPDSAPRSRGGRNRR